jgi:hypothetical protein
MAQAVGERRKPRNATQWAHHVKLALESRGGDPVQVMARVLDVSDDGLGLQTQVALKPGNPVTVTGQWKPDQPVDARTRQAKVRWCVPQRDGGFRAGIVFAREAPRPEPPPQEESPRTERPNFERVDPKAAEEAAEMDCYDVLQVSPKADFEMIHRVYRLLAQRLHPDNDTTGNEEAFKRLQAAYSILSDPEKRAAYDVERTARKELRFKIFASPGEAEGVTAEVRKRQGILSLLYRKRLASPENPHMNLFEMEDLLGCPREHLEFSLWYLREQGRIQRTDNGRFAITIAGVDAAEEFLLKSGTDRPLLTTTLG